jgi:hypothetical protein
VIHLFGLLSTGHPTVEELATKMIFPVEAARAFGLVTIGWRPASEHGFSGAPVWLSNDFILKGQPGNASSEDHLARIAHAMDGARPAVGGCIPQMRKNLAGRWSFACAGRVWECQSRMPGKADFHAQPSEPRVRAIVNALSAAHHSWNQDHGQWLSEMPGIQRREDQLHQGLTLLHGHRPALTELQRRLAAVLPTAIATALQILKEFPKGPFRCHACLCDAWHDHWLFEHDQLTGLIDWSALKIDHPAVDYARTLGSLFPGDSSAQRVAFQHASMPFPWDWVEKLRQTGDVVAGVYWYRQSLQKALTRKEADRALALIPRLQEASIPTLRA